MKKTDCDRLTTQAATFCYLRKFEKAQKFQDRVLFPILYLIVLLNILLTIYATVNR